MIIINVFASSQNILNKQFSISIENNISLDELLIQISDILQINFSLRIDSKIEFPNYICKKKKINIFLDEISEIFNLEYVLENDTICIQNKTNYIESYFLPFFQCNTKNTIETQKPRINLLEHNNNYFQNNLSQNVVFVHFWQEVENNINLICGNNKNYSIDRYNGIINVITNKKSHIMIKKYIENIYKYLYKQVLIECYIMEIIAEEGVDVPIGRAISSISTIDRRNLFSNVSVILNFINNFAQHYHHKIDVNCYSDMSILTMSQQVGKIQLLNIYSMKNMIRTENFKSNFTVSETRFEKNDISSGFSIEVLPIVLNDQNIMLQVFPVLSRVRDFNQDIPLLTQSELSTSFLIESGETIFIGGLEFLKEEKKKRRFSLFDKFISLFNSKNKNKKSKLIIALRATIVNNNNKEKEKELNLIKTKGEKND